MKKTWFALVLILCAGAALRYFYLLEISRAPDFTAPLADPAFHDYWARALLDGDWAPPPGELDPRIPSVPFQRPPGYPYFLAGVYAVTGGSHFGTRLIQMGLGLVNCLLAFALARRLLGQGAGLLVAALCATSFGMIYFEGELHAPVLITALHLGLAHLLVGWSARPGAWRALGAGAVLGVTALVQANALLFAPVGALWMAKSGRSLGRPGLARSAAAFLVGVALAIAPATVRNWKVSKPHDFVLIGSNGAVNLYIGNNAEADGVSVKIPNLQEIALMNTWSWFSYDRIVAGLSIQEGRPLKYSEASRVFSSKAWEFIRSNPGKFLGLCLKRAVLFWAPVEVSNNKAVQVDKDESHIMRWLPGFAVYSSFASLGLLSLKRGTRRSGKPVDKASVAARAAGSGVEPPSAAESWKTVAGIGLALFVVTYFLSFVPFLAAARFRAPILPFVFLATAIGVQSLVAAFRVGDWGRLGKSAALWLGLFLVARHSFFEAGPDKAWWHTDRAAALVQEGKLNEAVFELQEALRANPGYIDAHVNLGGVLTELRRFDEAVQHYQEVIRHRPDRSDVRLRLGELYMQARRYEEAAVELDAVAKANPTSAVAHFEWGRALIELGRLDEGVAALTKSLEFEPKQAAAHVNLGVAAKQKDPQAALAHFEEALRIDPNFADAHLQLGHVYRALGRLKDAESSYQEAFRLNPEVATPAIAIGNLHLVAKENEDAMRWFRRAIGIDPRNMIARCSLAGALANSGDFEGAEKELLEALKIEPSHQLANERLQVIQNYLASRNAGSAGTNAQPGAGSDPGTGPRQGAGSEGNTGP